MGTKGLSAHVSVDEIAAPAAEALSGTQTVVSKKKERKLRMFLQGVLENMDLAKRQKVGDNATPPHFQIPCP
jgi:hypothetical protein